MITQRIVLMALGLLALAGCETPGPNTPPARGPSKPHSHPTPTQTNSSATQSLVRQAQAQTAKGDYANASATIERALRIEPENPLLWIELGIVREAEGIHSLADAMARKALAVAGGDTRARSAAWHLIAQSKQTHNHNNKAREAEQKAR